MQQTEKYQFNLIESSDRFSPDPLNENTQRLEEQLDNLRAEAIAGDDALDQRIQSLEARHFQFGTYVGSSDINQDINLGFTPKLVIIPYNNTAYTVLTNFAAGSGAYVYLRIIDGGFRGSHGLNAAGTTYHYLAAD